MTLLAKLDARGLDWIIPDWPAPKNVRALMTTRNGGFSTGPCATMNVAGNNGDDPDAVARNRQLLEEVIGVPPAWLSQVHGTHVADLDSVDAGAGAPTADAGVGSKARRAVVVRVADCLPVLFCDKAGTRVGAAHAGWRGLSAGVIETTVAARNVPPRNNIAWMGPAIGPTAFEVGDDVRDAFVDADGYAAAAFDPYPGRPDKWLADIYALAALRLQAAGVKAIYGGDLCTVSDPARFFSYRRDKSPGRMAALVWLE
jgi:YfiH family protein